MLEHGRVGHDGGEDGGDDGGGGDGGGVAAVALALAHVRVVLLQDGLVTVALVLLVAAQADHAVHAAN